MIVVTSGHASGRASAVALWGLGGKIVSIEAGVSAGLPGIDIVGLPDTSVSESRKRLRAALAYLGTPVASQHLTINLTPGTVPKRSEERRVGKEMRRWHYT